MTAEQFAVWLKGFMSALMPGMALTMQQTELIKAKLDSIK